LVNFPGPALVCILDVAQVIVGLDIIPTSSIPSASSTHVLKTLSGPVASVLWDISAKYYPTKMVQQSDHARSVHRDIGAPIVQIATRRAIAFELTVHQTQTIIPTAHANLDTEVLFLGTKIPDHTMAHATLVLVAHGPIKQQGRPPRTV